MAFWVSTPDRTYRTHRCRAGASVSSPQIIIHRRQFDDPDRTSIDMSDILHPDFILPASTLSGTIYVPSSIHPRSHTEPTTRPKRVLLADLSVIPPLAVCDVCVVWRWWVTRIFPGWFVHWSSKCKRTGCTICVLEFPLVPLSSPSDAPNSFTVSLGRPAVLSLEAVWANPMNFFDRG